MKKKKKENVTLREFYKTFRSYIFWIIPGFVFLVITRIAVTIEPLFLRNIIDKLTGERVIAASITLILVYYFGTKLVGVISDFFRDYFMSPAIMGVTRDFEKKVFSKLLSLPVSYHADQKAGSAAKAITRGAQATSMTLDFSISQLLPPIFELIFASFLLYSLFTWHYATITLVTIIIYTIFTIWSTNKRTKLRMLGNKEDDKASGILVDSISNIDTVKYFNNESSLFGSFLNTKNKWFKLMVKNNRMFALIFSVQGIILLIGLGLIMILAVNQSISGGISVGDLVLVTTYVVRLSAPVSMLGFTYGMLKNNFADIQAMEGILSQTSNVEEPKNPKSIKNPKGAIEFNNVIFGYDKSKNIIKGLDVKIKPGEKVAFVGPSGSGKSTIVKLLFRLYDVNSGDISIDGVDVKKLSATSKRNTLSIVPQEPNLFNDSFTTNIKFGTLSATHKEVVKSAKIAHIHDFINSLPKKYDTIVGERGVKISGGEKQRVAIARSVIKDPKILVFDEATSSLDSESEKACLEAIEKASVGRTSISIAHRLSTIIDSDKIFVLKNGKVFEEGTHRTLLDKKGLYSKLWKIQTKQSDKFKTKEEQDKALKL